MPRSADAAALYPPAVETPPEDLNLIGYLMRALANPLRAFPLEAYEAPIVPYKLWHGHLFWVTGPQLVEQVLLTEQPNFIKTEVERRVFEYTLRDGVLTANGQNWRWQRRIAAPLFRHSELLRYVSSMTEAAERRLSAWRQMPSGSMIDMEAEMKEATFDVISSTVLSGCLPEEARLIKWADNAYLDKITWEIVSAVAGLPKWVWHPGKRKMRAAGTKLRQAVAGILERRRREPGGAASADDLLARLMSASDPETGARMPDGSIVDNMTTFLEAGHETTARALAWTLYLLARTPALQDELRAEMLAAAGDATIGPEHMAQLPLTDRVFKEALRLYPSAPFVARVAVKETTLGEHKVPAGSLIIVPIYVIHRHKQLWVDPDRFDPDRFLPEREAIQQRAQYMPFGFGARTCIGNSFALIEATAILGTVLRRTRFEWDGKHMPEPISRVTLRPDGGMPLRVQHL